MIRIDHLKSVQRHAADGGAAVTIDPGGISAANGHGGCLLCGPANSWSLKIAFKADDYGIVRSRLQSHPGLQGYDGIIHGGVISAPLDAAMTHCLFHQSVRAVTGDLRVRFVRSMPCRSVLDLKAWVISVRPPLYCLRAEAMNTGQVAAWAEGKFMQQGGVGAPTPGKHGDR